MALFRPYQPKDPSERGTSEPLVPTPAASNQDTSTAPTRNPGPAKKDRPTPTRREAEAARRERLNPTLSKKDARGRDREANRKSRMEAMAKQEQDPARELLRDHVDARFRIGELVLPVMLIILASVFLQSAFPQLVLFSTVVMYVFLGLVILDYIRTWRGFRRIADERHITIGRGMKMYALNRMIQIRPMRMPKPRIKRGDSY